jgi:hypothetical protein
MRKTSRAVRLGGHVRDSVRAKSGHLASTDGVGMPVRGDRDLRGRTDWGVRHRHRQWRTARAPRGRSFRALLHLQVGSGCRRSGSRRPRTDLDGPAGGLRSIGSSRIRTDNARTRFRRLYVRRSPSGSDRAFALRNDRVRAIELRRKSHRTADFASREPAQPTIAVPRKRAIVSTNFRWPRGATIREARSSQR